VVQLSRFRSRRLVALLSLPLLMWACGSHAQMQGCHPIAFPPLNGSSWEEDTSYELAVRAVEGGKIAITVVGDKLVLDAQRFASLVRTVDKAAGNVQELVLDAREVRIVESIALQSARIRIQAHTVAFESAGALVLTRPAGDLADGLEINAFILDLRRSGPVPVQVSVAAGSNRKISIAAGELLGPAGTLVGDPAGRLLWRRSSNFDGSGFAAPAAWNVQVNRDGLDRAIEAGLRQAAWPSFFAYKVRKHHAFAPFNVANKSAVAQRIAAYRPVLEQLDAGEALLALNSTSDLMRQNVDARGFGPAYVPSEDLVVALDRFRGSLKRGKDHFGGLADLIISAHSTPRVDVEALQQARDRLRALTEAQERTAAEVANTFTQVEVLTREAEVIDAAIVYEKGESRKRLEELKERDKDLANIKAVTTVVAIGASFIGTPATGAAIATGVSVAGDVVYGHNAGQPVNLETLASIGKKNADLYAALRSAQAAWEKHIADERVLTDVFKGKKVQPEGAKKPLTRADAAKKTAESAGEFAAKVKSVLDSLGSMPKPDSLSLNQLEAENSALQGHLQRLATNQAKIAAHVYRLGQLQAALLSDGEALAATRTIEQVLLELKPVNDQELLRWKTAALALWNRELMSLYHDAMDLRRGLLFETWKVVDLPADVQRYPEEVTAYLASGRYSPEQPIGTTPATLTREHLNRELGKHLSVLNAIANGVASTWEAYKRERATGARPFFDQGDFANRSGAPAVHKLFLEQVNAQIRRQVENPQLRNERQLPLLIPISMDTRPPLDLPERLLQVGVAKPEFVSDAALVGKNISFDITSRLAGELRKGDTCWYVDLAAPGGQAVSTMRQPSVDVASAQRDAELPVSFEDLRRSRTAPPARTLYFLSVVVDGSPQDANWSRVPEIKSFTFWRRIVQ